MGHTCKMYKKKPNVCNSFTNFKEKKIKKIPPKLFSFFPKHTKKGNFLQIVILVLDNFPFF